MAFVLLRLDGYRAGLTQLSEANLQKGGQSALKNGEIEIVLGDGRLGYPEQGEPLLDLVFG